MVCHYRFFNHGFKFQGFVSNGCHNLTMLSPNTSDIITVKGVNYRYFIYDISKSEAINSVKSFVLEDRGYI